MNDTCRVMILFSPTYRYSYYCTVIHNNHYSISIRLRTTLFNSRDIILLYAHSVLYICRLRNHTLPVVPVSLTEEGTFITYLDHLIM